MSYRSLLLLVAWALVLPLRADGPFTGVYHCEKGGSFTARIDGEVAWLMFPDDAVRLARDPDGSGRFIAGEWSLERSGERIRVKGPAGRFEGCRSDPEQARWAAARLDGVDFRAVGPADDPWVLELRTRRSATLLRGNERLRLPLGHPAVDEGGNTVYRMQSNGRHMTLIIRRQACELPLPGEGRQVAILVDGSDLTGCGIALQ